MVFYVRMASSCETYEWWFENFPLIKNYILCKQFCNAKYGYNNFVSNNLQIAI